MKKKRKMNVLRVVICSAIIFFLIAMGSQSFAAQEDNIENALVEFHNKFLPGVDNYQTEIRYPKSDDYYFAWASLVIAVGEDTAIILTAGHSEAVVKVVEKGITAVDVGTGVVKAIDGKPVEAAVEYAVGEAVDKGLKKAVGKSVPGFRSGYAVYGVFKAGDEEEERVFSSVSEQREIQQFVGEIAPAIVDMQKQINDVESPQKRLEYQQMLSAMLKKRAELTVYRQMQQDNYKSSIGGIEHDILNQINPAMASELANGKLTPNWQLSNAANEYAEGRITKDQFHSQIKDYMRNNTNEPSSYSESMMDKRLNAIEQKIHDIDKARSKINQYGGSSLQTNTAVNNYSALDKAIPQSYRMIANLNVSNLSKEIPSGFKSTEPNQGTSVPAVATASVPKYLRTSSGSGGIQTGSSSAGGYKISSTPQSTSLSARSSYRPTINASYKPMTRKAASTIVKKYGSVPGGVTLEGDGEGIRNITSALFRPNDGTILLNGSILYEIPVTQKEMKTILLAIAADNEIGVSLVSGYTTYGALPKDSNISLILRQTDWFLAHLAYGWKRNYTDYKIANNDRLKKRDDELGNVMCYFRFCDYKFALAGSRYELKSSSFFTTLIPIKVGEYAADGGGLPDFEAIEGQKYPENLLYNIKHIADNAEYYMRERMLRMVNCYGEAAAFGRALKRNGIDIKQLAASM